MCGYELELYWIDAHDYFGIWNTYVSDIEGKLDTHRYLIVREVIS